MRGPWPRVPFRWLTERYGEVLQKAVGTLHRNPSFLSQSLGGKQPSPREVKENPLREYVTQGSLSLLPALGGKALQNIRIIAAYRAATADVLYLLLDFFSLSFCHVNAIPQAIRHQALTAITALQDVRYRQLSFFEPRGNGGCAK